MKYRRYDITPAYLTSLLISAEENTVNTVLSVGVDDIPKEEIKAHWAELVAAGVDYIEQINVVKKVLRDRLVH